MRWTAKIGRTDPWSWALAFSIGLGAFIGCSASGGGPEIGPPGTGGGAASAGAAGEAGSEQQGGATGDDASIDDSSTGGGGAAGDGGSTGQGGQTSTGGSGGGVGGAAGTGGWDNCVPLSDPGSPPQPTDVVISGAPANAATLFGGSVDPQRAPTIVYPPDGVLMPPNIATLDVQFLPGTGNDLFEVSFANPGVDVRFYTKCSAVGSGCSLKIDGSNFSSMAAKAAGLEPMTMRIRGVSQASPSSVGESSTISVGIAEMPMLGGIYYWDASGEVVRYDFGYPTAKGEHYYTAMNGGAMCVGCHSLSLPGHLMAVGLGMPAPSTLRVINVSDKSTIYTLSGVNGSNFQAFSPDEAEIITSNGKNMILRDTATGAVLKNPLVQKGTMPDYHPDNTSVVFSKSDDLVLVASPGITKGSIMLLPRNGSTWGPEKTLVATTNDDNNYYPAFSPDGAWVLFNRAHDEDSYLAPNSLTMVVNANGGTAVALSRANISDQVGNSWPKWAPYKQCNRGKRLLWYTVSSARDYGLKIINSDKQPDPDAGDPRRWQIWMAAFDPEKAANGEDPSYPAFWLPFQDTDSGNHIAQWVQKVIRNPCVDDSQCPSNAQQKMVCKNNECVPQ